MDGWEEDMDDVLAEAGGGVRDDWSSKGCGMAKVGDEALGGYA